MKKLAQLLWTEPVFAAAVLSVAAVELVPAPLGVGLAAVFAVAARQLVTPTKKKVN